MQQSTQQQQQRLQRFEYGLKQLGFLLALLSLAFLIWSRTAAATNEPDILPQILQQVRTMGSYQFKADITQQSIPIASVQNVGASSKRQDLRIEGETDLNTQVMQMTLWGQGGNVLDPSSGLQLKSEDGRLWARRGGESWQEMVMRLEASDGSVRWDAATLTDNQWSYTPKISTAGNYRLIVEAWNQAGNGSTAGPYTLSVTNEMPIESPKTIYLPLVAR